MMGDTDYCVEVGTPNPSTPPTSVACCPVGEHLDLNHALTNPPTCAADTAPAAPIPEPSQPPLQAPTTAVTIVDAVTLAPLPTAPLRGAVVTAHAGRLPASCLLDCQPQEGSGMGTGAALLALILVMVVCLVVLLVSRHWWPSHHEDPYKDSPYSIIDEVEKENDAKRKWSR